MTANGSVEWQCRPGASLAVELAELKPEGQCASEGIVEDGLGEPAGLDGLVQRREDRRCAAARELQVEAGVQRLALTTGGRAIQNPLGIFY